MRPGRSHRADAILNSPIVRALINARPAPQLLASKSPAAPIVTNGTLNDSAHLSLPHPSDLISTQPGPVHVVDLKGKGKKREREPDDAVMIGPSVEVSYTVENLPPELKKYWAQRYRLFSLFDEGVQMDLEGWYSVTPEAVAEQIAERCRCNVIVDAFCGVGGNAIQFAQTCEKVIAIDKSPIRLACARHNAELYGVADRIEFILGDALEWQRDYVKRKAAGQVKSEDEVEVVFLSPPWGGIDYQTAGAVPGSANKKQKRGTRDEGNGDTASTSKDDGATTKTRPTHAPYPLGALGPVSGDELFKLARQITPHVAFYLPRNVDIEEVGRLPLLSPRQWTPEEKRQLGRDAVKPMVEPVEIEEEWMGWKLKAVTVYFGDLASNSKFSWIDNTG